MQSRLIIFLEILALLGGVAWFSSQHKAHLDDVQKSIGRIEAAVKTNEKTLQDLKAVILR